jgi:enamine deaminase RidA (YjgF/YER057c/UK114 family)
MDMSGITRHIQTKINHRVVEHAGVLHFGGLVADDMSKDMKGQTAEICGKIDALLEQVGSTREKLLTAMIYVSDFSQKDGMNEAWLEWLPGEHLPTRATIGGAELGENVLVEIVVSAAK